MMYQFCGGHRVTKIKLPSNADPSTSILSNLSTAVDIQIDTLGVQNMLLGIVTPKFSESQRIYYKQNSFGKNFNAERWGKWFIRLMMDFSQAIWKYRCEILHARQEGTMEHRLRDLAVSWLVQLKNTPTLLPVDSRYLANRSIRHFKTGALRSVNAWIRRIDIELKRKRESAHAGDIRNWIQRHSQSQHNSESSTHNKLSATSASQTLDDNASTSSDVTDISYISCSVGATRDLHIDDDTLPTFLYSKTTTSTSYVQNVPPFPNEILFAEDTVLQQNMFHIDTDDRYANVRFHESVPKILYDPDDVHCIPAISGTMVD